MRVRGRPFFDLFWAQCLISVLYLYVDFSFRTLLTNGPDHVLASDTAQGKLDSSFHGVRHAARESSTKSQEWSYRDSD